MSSFTTEPIIGLIQIGVWPPLRTTKMEIFYSFFAHDEKENTIYEAMPAQYVG